MANEKKMKVKKEKIDVKAIPAAANATTPSAKKEKKKKSVSPAKPVALEITPDSPEPAEVELEKNGDDSDWPKDDDMELFQRIKKALPADDSMKFDSRINNLDWESIAFGEYTADECKERWTFVQGHLRRYRLVSELVDDAVTWRIRPWTNFNKGGKFQQHPDYPKKPLTSYMLFYMEKKDEVLEKQPGLGMTDLSKVIAKLYNEMNDRKKQKYVEQAQREKEQFNANIKKFMEDHPDYVPLKPDKFVVKAEPPKAPTPFKVYSEAKLPKFLAEGLSAPEAREKCRETFKELSQKQRLKWIYKALALEPKYIEDYDKFVREHPDVEIGAKKSVLSKDEKHLKEKTEGKPEKPPNSGYSLYSKKLLASSTLKHLESKERMTEISRMWKELSEDERKSYNEEAQQMIWSYKMEYASYLESLQPEQREAELASSQSKAVKRANNLKKNKEEPEAKKNKKDEEPAAASIYPSSDEDESSDEEEEEENDVQGKSAIQKPKSSLQMFCDTNMDKYKKKNPKLSQQELSRLMAKTFSKLSDGKKKMYETMALKSKSSAQVVIKPPAKTPSPTKSLSKVTPKATAKAILSTVATSKANAKANAVTKTIKPALNATAKSSPERPKPKGKAAKANTKTTEQPFWIARQQLFTNEPAKPPEDIEHFYAYIILQDADLTPKEINDRWEKLPEKQKKKHMASFQKKHAIYVKDFENFVRTLPSEELKSFRTFMKTRGKTNIADSSDEEDEDSDDGDSSKEEVNDEDGSSSDQDSISDDDSSN